MCTGLFLTFAIACAVVYPGPWTPPAGYCGPDAVKYWSLDNLDGVTDLYSGSPLALITGKVGHNTFYIQYSNPILVVEFFWVNG